MAAAAFWGTTGTTQALGPAEAHPLTVGAVRITTGAVLLVGWTVVVGRGAEVAAVLRGGRWRIGVGGLAAAAYQLAFFTGVSLTGVAVGTLVGIGSAPVATGLHGILTGERPSRAWVVGTALTIVGAGALVLPGGDVALHLGGVAGAVAAGVSYAFYTVVSKGLLDAGHLPAPVMAALFGIGGVVLLPVLLVGETGWVATPPGLVATIWLGVVTLAAANLLYAVALRSLPAASVASLTLTEPLTATALALLLLGEPATPATLVGAGLIVAGLAVVARRGRPAGEVVAV